MERGGDVIDSLGYGGPKFLSFSGRLRWLLVHLSEYTDRDLLIIEILRLEAEKERYDNNKMDLNPNGENLNYLLDNLKKELTSAKSCILKLKEKFYMA